MNEIQFVEGNAWVVADEDGVAMEGEQAVLTDPSKAVTGESESGKRLIVMFSDVDLAERFARAAGVPGYVAAGLAGARNLLNFLEAQRDLGTTHVVLDPTFGRKTAAEAPIEEVIRDTRKSIE